MRVFENNLVILGIVDGVFHLVEILLKLLLIKEIPNFLLLFFQPIKLLIVIIQ